jgi:hypothetical protein
MQDSGTVYWGKLDPLAQQVKEGQLDGFFVPFELADFLPESWPDKSPVRRYNSLRGVLAFRQGAYKNYGYATEEEFAQAVLANRVVAKTVNGAISLGACRFMGGRPIFIKLILPQFPVGIIFYADTQEELVGIKQYLMNILPDAEIRHSDDENALTYAFSTLPKISDVPAMVRQINERQRKALLILVLIALVIILVSLMSMIGWLPNFLDLFLFAGFLIAFYFALPYLRKD